MIETTRSMTAHPPAAKGSADIWRSLWNWSWPMLLLASIFLGAQLFFFPAYNTNDDPAIRLALEGRLLPNGTVTGQIYFINLGLGEVLAALYRQAPSIPWYDIFEESLLAAAFLGVLRILPEHGTLRWGTISFVSILFLETFAQPQFTVAAILASGTGALILGLAACGRLGVSTRAELLFLSTFGGILLFAGFLFRLEAACLSFIFVASCMTVGIEPHERWSEPSYAIPLTAILLVLGMSAALWVSHFVFYGASSEWADFYRFNALRAAATEYATNLNSAHAVSGTLSHDDQMALSNWIIFDPKAFPAQMLAHSGESSLLDRFSRLSAKKLLVSGADSLQSLRPMRFALVGLALGAWTSRYRRAFFISVATLMLLILFSLLFLKASPWRIMWPLGMLEFAILANCGLTEISKSPLRTCLIYVSLLGAALSTLHSIAVTSQFYSRDSAELATDINASRLRDAPEIISIGEGIMPQYLERPFRAGPIQTQLKVIFVGTLTRSPLIMHDLQRWSPRPLSDQICGSTRVLTVAEPSAIEALRRYYFNHRSIRVQFRNVYSGQIIKVFDCQSP